MPNGLRAGPESKVIENRFSPAELSRRKYLYHVHALSYPDADTSSLSVPKESGPDHTYLSLNGRIT